MRIAWISYDFLEYSSLHVNALSKEHEVLAVLPKQECIDEEHQLDADVKCFLFDKPRLRQPIKQNRSIRSILRALAEFRPEVVHFQQSHLWFNFSLKKLQKHFPLVITIHDPRHHSGDAVSKKTPQWVVDHGFRQADHAIVHGRKLVPAVCDLFGFQQDQVHVIPHVAMGNMSNGGQIDSSLTDPNTILFFGRIWDYKGLNYLIQAEPYISRECPDARFVIAGQGDDFQKYRDMMENPKRFVVHNQWITDEERAEFFSQAGVVVLPYTDATQSGVVPVAYNYQKPVVATRVGALSDCVADGETGLLVPPKDPQALAAAIVRLLKNPTLAQKMGKAGRDWVEDECSPEAVARQHVEAYKKAVIFRANQLGQGAATAFPTATQLDQNTKLEARNE